MTRNVFRDRQVGHIRALRYSAFRETKGKRFRFKLVCGDCEVIEEVLWTRDALTFFVNEDQHFGHETRVTWTERDRGNEPKEPTKHDLQNAETDTRIYQAVESGFEVVSSIKNVTGLSKTTIHDHLARLEQDGRIVRMEQGGMGRGKVARWQVKTGDNVPLHL